MYQHKKAAVLLPAVLMISIFSCASKKPDYSGWKATIGYVYKMWEVDGTEVSYRYKVNGVTYSEFAGVPYGTIYYDRFIILYNPDNPSESILGCSDPYFYPGDSVSFAEGEIKGKSEIRPLLEREAKLLLQL